MEYVKRAFGVGVFFYIIGVLTIPIPHASALSAAAGGIGTALLIGTGIAWMTIRIRSRKLPSKVNVIRFIAAPAISLIFPFAVVALATSGQTVDTLFRGDNYNWQHWTVHLLSSATLWLLYIILIELPFDLYKYAPKDKVSETSLNLVPSWCSGIAAILTSVLIFLMHFARGPLSHTPITQVLIAATAVATLLLPFFKWLVIRVWSSGIIDMFSFSRWKGTVFAVIDDIMSVSMPHWFHEDEPDKFGEHLKECRACQTHVKECLQCRVIYNTESQTGHSMSSEN